MYSIIWGIFLLFFADNGWASQKLETVVPKVDCSTAFAATSQDHQEIWERLNFREFYISKEIIAMMGFPAESPFNSSHRRNEEFEPSKGKEVSPFVFKLLRGLEEEIGEIERLVGKTQLLLSKDWSLVNAKNPVNSKAPTFDNLALEDFSDRRQLRAKLMNKLFEEISSKALFNVLLQVRENPDKFTIPEPQAWGNYGIQRLGVGEIYAGIGAHPAKSRIPYSPEMALRPNHYLRLAKEYEEAGDLQRSGYFKDRALLEGARSSGSGGNFKPAQESISEVLATLFSEAAKTVPGIEAKWIQYVAEHSADPSLYRVITHNGDFSKDPIVFLSLPKLLLGFELELMGADKTTFRLAREGLNLSGPSLDQMESSLFAPSFLKPEQSWKYFDLKKGISSQPILEGKGAHENGDRTQKQVDPEAVVSALVRQNGFKVDRDILAYLTRFPEKLSTLLASLGPDGHWIDMGAGEGRAIESFFSPNLVAEADLQYQGRIKTEMPAVWEALNTIASKSLDQKPKVSGITKVSGRKSPIDNPKVRLLEGRFLSEIKNEEILKGYGKAAVITDLFGVFAYAPSPSETMKQYLRLMDSKGSLFIHFPRGAMTESQVNVNGKAISLLEWMKGLEQHGLDVTYHSKEGDKNGSFEIVFKQGETGDSVAARIPDIELLSTDSAQPPARMFRQRTP